MACLTIGHPNTYGSHPVPRHRQPLHLRTMAPRTTRSISALRQSNFHKQLLESLTTSSIDRAIVLTQSAPHTGALFMQLHGEAFEAEDPSSIVMACPDKSAAGQLCITIAMAAATEKVLTAGMRQWPDASRDTLTQWHEGLHRTCGSSPHSCGERPSGTCSHGPCCFNHNGSTTYLDVAVGSHFSSSPALIAAASTRQVTWPRELRKSNLTDIHMSTLSRSS